RGPINWWNPNLRVFFALWRHPMDAATEFRNCGMAAPGSALLPISRRFLETLASRASTRNDEPRASPPVPLSAYAERGDDGRTEFHLSRKGEGIKGVRTTSWRGGTTDGLSFPSPERERGSKG